jgi:hypothetical protein
VGLVGALVLALLLAGALIRVRRRLHAAERGDPPPHGLS